MLGLGGCPVSPSYFSDFTDNKTSWLVGAGGADARATPFVSGCVETGIQVPLPRVPSARSHSLTLAGLFIYLFLAAFFIRCCFLGDLAAMVGFLRVRGVSWAWPSRPLEDRLALLGSGSVAAGWGASEATSPGASGHQVSAQVGLRLQGLPGVSRPGLSCGFHLRWRAGPLACFCPNPW